MNQLILIVFPSRGLYRTSEVATMRRTVAVIGGGLAGLAAAAVLCERNFQVVLFEARRRLGGRAGSYRDEASGQWIDHCQHVGMACCTNLVDFCRRTEIADGFRRYDTLYFFGPDGRRCDFQATRWLPAPLHLARALFGLKFLSLGERVQIARALLRLARQSAAGAPDGITIGEWLRRQQQSPRAIEYFWEVVLVSALGETLERASLPAAGKVFVDGFLTNRDAYCVDVPTASLHELYDGRVAKWLRGKGTKIHLATRVTRIAAGECDGVQVEFNDGSQRCFNYAVLAIPWRAVGTLLDSQLAEAIPLLKRTEEIQASPITGVHLWFDCAVVDLPHAVLVGRLSQWVFRRESNAGPQGHYYQVVISASRALQGRDQEDVVREVVADLASIWPEAGRAALLNWQVVTEREAVFSVRPGFEQLRPPQKTPIRNLALAGDWTATGWPATMEGAVRSGYLAAEAVLEAAGKPERVLATDLPREWLARLLFGSLWREGLAARSRKR